MVPVVLAMTALRCAALCRGFAHQLRRLVGGLIIAAAIRRWLLRQAAHKAALREEPQWLRDAEAQLLFTLGQACSLWFR